MRRPSPPLVSPRAFAVGALADALGAAVFAHPLAGTLASPFDEENELAASLGPLRGPHLLGGRLAAHAALAALGRAPVPLARESTGAVGWPPGVVGAIAHTHGLAVAVVGEGVRFHGIGIDVEYADRQIDAGTRRLLAREDEHPWLERPPVLPASALLLLASAKEVVFKAYFPPTQIRLRFEDARVTPSPRGFQAEILREGLDLPNVLDIELAAVGPHLVLAGALPR